MEVDRISPTRATTHRSDQKSDALIPTPLRDRMGLVPGAERSLGVTDAGDGGPALELRQVPHVDDPTGALVREGSLRVHDGRPAGEMDVARLIREQRGARVLQHGSRPVGGVSGPGPTALATSVLVAALDADDHAAAIARMAGPGLVGGAVSDALHVRAAEKTGAAALVTINGRYVRRTPPAAPCRLVVL